MPRARKITTAGNPAGRPAHAGNFMMSLAVEDADLWWEYIQRKEIAKKYPGIMCRAPP
jgi:hypothetical protein